MKIPKRATAVLRGYIRAQRAPGISLKPFLEVIEELAQIGCVVALFRPYRRDGGSLESLQNKTKPEGEGDQAAWEY